jgi:hypothetical protein
MTTTVFIGNCQVWALGMLYGRHIARPNGDHVHYIASYENLSPENRQALVAADVLVTQVFDFEPPVLAEIDLSRRPVYRAPVVSAGFLWPFSGRGHPRNAPLRFLDSGPYPAELGDTFLNRLIAAGTPPEEALQRYLDFDFRGRMDLDRLLEIFLDKQRDRDDRAGIATAGLIEAHFRDESIFLTAYHPNSRIFAHLATQLFERMGIDAATVAHMLASRPPRSRARRCRSIRRSGGISASASPPRRGAIRSFPKAASPSPSMSAATCAASGTRRCTRAS